MVETPPDRQRLKCRAQRSQALLGAPELALKRAQLEMLVRIRNLLTPQQKEMLRVLRGRE